MAAGDDSFKTRRRKVLHFLVPCAFLALAQDPAFACNIPEGSNLNSAPKFWCSLSANVSIVNNCTTTVEETIILPWSAGTVDRHVPHQVDQTVTVVSAVLRTEKEHAPLQVVKSSSSSKDKTVLNIGAPRSQSSIQIILRYTVDIGVLRYQKCSVMDFPDASGPGGSSRMLVKWAPGGTSADEIKRLEVVFSLIRDTRNTYLDSLVKRPKEFALASVEVTTDKTKTAIVTHSGNAEGMLPGLFLFYFRYGLDAGWAQCGIFRSCRAESRHLEEGSKKALKPGVIVGIVLGLGLVAVAVGVGLWIQRGRRKRRAMDKGDDDPNLPKSLEHFAYDTGDERSSAKWKEWTESGPNSRKSREINAISLSPRNQSQKGLFDDC